MMNKSLNTYSTQLDDEPILDDTPIEIVVAETGELLDAEEELETTPDLTEAAHGENLAEYLTDEQKTALITKISTRADRDNEARQAWLDTVAMGYKLLGTAIEQRTTPWAGACGAHSALMLETLVRFIAEAGNESWPTTGPCRGTINSGTPDVIEASKRVENRINEYLTIDNRGARSEHERALFSCGLTGSGFKKMFLNHNNEPVCQYIPADHVILPAGATDMRSAPYYIHKLSIFHDDYLRSVESGMYLDIDLKEPDTGGSPSEHEAPDRARDKAAGIDRQSGDNRHEFYEAHIDLDALDLPDGQTAPRRYIVTYDIGTDKLLSVYRGWAEGDAKYKPIPVMVQYTYLVGDTPYGFGLVHLLGNATHTSTMAIRNLVDAGTLSNLPAGYKTRQARFTNSNEPLKPGEFRDVELSMGLLKDSFLPLPFKEPSAVLFNMLQSIGEEARRFVATADLSLSDMPDNSGSMGTLGVLERSAQYSSAVMTRLYSSLSEELSYLKRLLGISDLVPAEPSYDGEAIKADFELANITPVADPKNNSQAQRLTLVNAAQSFGSVVAPELINKRELLLEGYRIIGLDKPERFVLPPPQETPPMEPIAENMAVLNGQPVKVFPEQDHQAHIKAHQAFMMDPSIQGVIESSPMAQMIIGGMDAHLREHFAFDYMRRVEQSLGTPIPPGADGIDPAIAGMLAQAADMALGKAQELAAAQEAAARMQDPIIQNQTRDLDIKEREVANKERETAQQHIVDVAKLFIEEESVKNDLIKSVQDATVKLKIAEMKPAPKATD